MKDVDEWLEEEFVSKKTRDAYRHGLKNFFSTVEASEVRNSDQLESAVKKWINHLRHSGKSALTINTYLNAVKSYFRDQGIEMSSQGWSNIKRRVKPPAREETNDKAGSHEEWKRIFNCIENLQGKSLFMFLLSSGARIGETLHLKTEDLELDENPPRANIRNEYTKGEHGGRTVFMTYEARDAIKDWLNVKSKSYIEDKDGSVRPKRKRSTKDYSRELDVDLVWDINDSTVWLMLLKALKKAGLDEKDTKTGRYKIHVHSCRKFFRSNCGLDEDLVHALMGHYGYLDRSYLRTDIDKAGEAYKAAIPKLTIMGTKQEVDKVEMIKEFARSLGMENIDIRVAKIREENPEVSEEEAVGKLIRSEFQLSNQTKKAYRQIDEVELVNYLNEGWEIVQQLNSSGKVIVAK